LRYILLFVVDDEHVPHMKLNSSFDDKVTINGDNNDDEKSSLSSTTTAMASR
jgi:hypothetical protein